MNFIEKANLPERKVKGVIVSDFIPPVIYELKNNYNIEAHCPSPLKSVTGSERFHADMCVCHLGNDLFICDSDNFELNKRLFELNAKVMTCKNITSKKPLLNVCILCGRMICDPGKTAEAILKEAIRQEIKILSVKQGYSRCSVAVVSHNAIITADKGIAAVCYKEGIDCLVIPPGYIKLDGYNYGFIGGCCGLLDKNTLAFTGSLNDHPSHDNIKSFAFNHGVFIAELTNGELYDIGGILPIY